MSPTLYLYSRICLPLSHHLVGSLSHLFCLYTIAINLVVTSDIKRCVSYGVRTYVSLSVVLGIRPGVCQSMGVKKKAQSPDSPRARVSAMSIDVSLFNLNLDVEMSSDVLANFSCLDELTQVIYQSAYRFVVLSTVSDSWTIHVGLAGPEGRWWRGTWAKADILQIVVRMHFLFSRILRSTLSWASLKRLKGLLIFVGLKILGQTT